MLDAGTFSKHFPLWSEQGGTYLTCLVMVGVKKCEEALPVSCPTPASRCGGGIDSCSAAAGEQSALSRGLGSLLTIRSRVTRYTLHVTRYTAHHTSRITLGDLGKHENVQY